MDQSANVAIGDFLTFRNHGELLRAIGGATHIARHLNLHRTVVQRWTVKGIPKKHSVSVARLAVRAGITITAEQIEELPRGG